jgi:hypothetical protein
MTHAGFELIDLQHVVMQQSLAANASRSAASVTFDGKPHQIAEVSAQLESASRRSRTPLVWLTAALRTSSPTAIRELAGLHTPFICVVEEGSPFTLREVLDACPDLPAVSHDDTGTVVDQANLQTIASAEGLQRLNLVETRSALRRQFVTDAIGSDEVWLRGNDGGAFTLRSKRQVTSFLSMKRVLGSSRVGFRLAYELGYELSDGYSTQLDDLGYFACSNDTGLIVASYLASIFAKNLLVLDHLGPVSHLRYDRFHKRESRPAVCLVEELVATGREVDMSALLLGLTGSELRSIAVVVKIGPSEPQCVSVQGVPFVKLCELPDTHAKADDGATHGKGQA